MLLFFFLSACFCSAGSSSSMGTTNTTDLEALLAIKSRITFDPTGVLLSSWNSSTSFCQWPGVACSRRRPRVAALDLRGLSLQGTIAQHVTNLSFITYLDLSGNSFSDQLPHSLGRLPRLRYLNTSANELSGSLPYDMFRSSSLQIMVLGMNKFSGGIPDGDAFHLPQLKILLMPNSGITGNVPRRLGGCKKLQKLALSNNQFVGDIPTELGNLSDLRTLDLSVNNLTSTIPRSLANLTNLQLLSLFQNNILGEIPSQLGTLQRLQLLNLGENMLTGAAPSSIFNISSMQKLQVSFNNLRGQLPESIGTQMPDLEGLYITENRFQGRISRSLSNATMLSILEFSDNLISGEVPTELGELRYLQTLSLQGNRLEGGLGFITSLTRCRFLENLLIGENNFGGQLPESVGNLSSTLLRLRIPNCQLRGEIPESLGNLSSLIYLNLHDNQLSGTIPYTIYNLQNLQLVYLYINSIQGPIPDELCRLNSLSILFLYENEFSGTVPTCLGNITRLQRLSLAANALSSKIPLSIWSLRELYFLNLSMNSLLGALESEAGDLHALGELDLSQNFLTGIIPSTLGNLQMLKYLVLSYNSFSGSIPGTFGRLINLQGMDLSSNKLTGGIPPSLANLSYLSYLNLSFNELEGVVPQGGVFANFTFEFSMGNHALCGEQRLGLPPCIMYVTQTKSKTRLLRYILPPIASAIVLSVIIIIILVIYRKRKISKPLQIEPCKNEHRFISYQQLVRATEDFSEANRLGVGGHGSVYKGRLDDGTLAAIKVLNLDAEGASKSFDAECQVLRMARHRNLVKIISTCANLDFKALVLQFIPNGSLERWLHSESCYLDLTQRVSIVLDVALAMEYLHHEQSEVVVHCDLKPGNVLLDEEMSAHVSDFGLARFLIGEKSIMQSSAPGTLGYMAPEYGATGKVSRASDVYSYGILLLESFTGKRPTDEKFAGKLSLRQWVSDAYSDSSLTDVIDPRLWEEKENGSVDQHLTRVQKDAGAMHKCLLAVMEVALLCSKDSPGERADMKDVAIRLKKIKKEMILSSSTTNRIC